MLQSRYAHDDPPHQPPRLVEAVVKTTLNPDTRGSPLLFPFLLSEAKRESSTEGFEQMEIQTCFPIKHALQLQYDLLHTYGNTMDVPGGPLIWFLANRGEDWRVYAGHVQVREGRPKYVGMNSLCIEKLSVLTISSVSISSGQAASLAKARPYS
jgi:hypothetical protein